MYSNVNPLIHLCIIMYIHGIYVIFIMTDDNDIFLLMNYRGTKYEEHVYNYGYKVHKQDWDDSYIH